MGWFNTLVCITYLLSTKPTRAPPWTIELLSILCCPLLQCQSSSGSVGESIWPAFERPRSISLLSSLKKAVSIRTCLRKRRLIVSFLLLGNNSTLCIKRCPVLMIYHGYPPKNFVLRFCLLTPHKLYSQIILFWQDTDQCLLKGSLLLRLWMLQFPWQHTHHLRINTQFSAPLGCPTFESRVLREQKFLMFVFSMNLKNSCIANKLSVHTPDVTFIVRGD